MSSDKCERNSISVLSVEDKLDLKQHKKQSYTPTARKYFLFEIHLKLNTSFPGSVKVTGSLAISITLWFLEEYAEKKSL